MSEISYKMNEKVYKYNNQIDIITHKEFFVNLKMQIVAFVNMIFQVKLFY